MSWKQLRALTGQAAEGASAPASSNFTGLENATDPAGTGSSFKSPEGRYEYVEVAFDSVTLHGTPASVTFGVWRLSDGRIDKMGLITIASADVGDPVPTIIDFHGEAIYVTVESFSGGTSPNVDVTIQARGVRL